jgi:flagellar assembly protein FliH
MAQCASEVAALRARLRHEAEADLVRLALAIARRVIRRELAVDPGAVRGLVMAALEKLRGVDVLRVRCFPAHADSLKGFLAEEAGRGSLEVVADASLEPGGVVFETQRGNLDASASIQLQEIERGLADRLRTSAP